MRAILVSLICLAIAGCDSWKVEDAVRRQMRDPDSTQFRDVRPCTNDKSVWQGEYNSKNGFGAYNGFQSFFYVDGTAYLLENGDPLDLIKRCYGKFADQEPAG